MTLFNLERGTCPVLVNVPHSGTLLCPGMGSRLSVAALPLPDTDWFVDRVYSRACSNGAGLMVATHSRYVVDLNRPPDDTALYSSRGTGLVPLETFAGQAIYRDGLAPDEGELERRVEEYWQPYHHALAAELNRLKEIHGWAVLLDGHSILSRVPLLFEGQLPDFSLGSNQGHSAAPNLASLAMDVLQSAPGRTSVLDGRFKGGYITRHYGQPESGFHALQLEMAQAAYMQESPPEPTESPMQELGDLLNTLVSALSKWRPEQA